MLYGDWLDGGEGMLEEYTALRCITLYCTALYCVVVLHSAELCLSMVLYWPHRVRALALAL